MNNESPMTRHHQPMMLREPVFFDGGGTVAGNAGWSDIALAASDEEARRQMAMDRPSSWKAPKPVDLDLPQPVLSKDHAQRATALEAAIYERGLPVNPDKLLQLGIERHVELVAIDREAREERAIVGTDFTSFKSVWLSFAHAGAVGTAGVPEPDTFDQFDGSDRELEEAAAVKDFDDLWKFSRAEGRAVRHVAAFHQSFSRLMMGQSLYVGMEEDGRIRNKFFARGSYGKKVKLFEAWLPAVESTSHRLLLKNSLAPVVWWLAGEESAPPTASELATDWTGALAPSDEQILLAQAVLDGYCLNFSDWRLWQFVGRATGKLLSKEDLSVWHEDLRRNRFPKIAELHRRIEKHFWKPRIGSHSEFKVDSLAQREFFEITVSHLQNCASEVAALCVEENYPAKAGPVVARFRDSILFQTTPKEQLCERVTERLSAVFPGGLFQVEIQ